MEGLGCPSPARGSGQHHETSWRMVRFCSLQAHPCVLLLTSCWHATSHHHVLQPQREREMLRIGISAYATGNKESPSRTFLATDITSLRIRFILSLPTYPLEVWGGRCWVFFHLQTLPLHVCWCDLSTRAWLTSCYSPNRTLSIACIMPCLSCYPPPPQQLQMLTKLLNFQGIWYAIVAAQRIHAKGKVFHNSSRSWHMPMQSELSL